MNLSIYTTKETSLLLAEGSMGESDLYKLAAEINRLPADQEKYILLDCVDLRKLIVSSVGFSGLINQLLDFRKKNAKIILFRYDKLTYRLLKLLKLDEMFHFSQSLDEAYLLLNKTYKETTA